MLKAVHAYTIEPFVRRETNKLITVKIKLVPLVEFKEYKWRDYMMASALYIY